MNILTGLFLSHEDAAAAINELKELGVTEASLSLITAVDSESTYVRNLIDEDPEEAAVEGAAMGGVLGSVLGLLGGIALVPLPGIGPVLASGLLSTASGGVLGGFLGSIYALRAESQPEINIKEALDTGAMLLVVNIDEIKTVGVSTDRLKQIYARHEAVHIIESEIDKDLTR